MSVYVFTSPFCGPCKTLKPVMKELEEDFPTLTWMYVDITSDPVGLTQKYKIKQVPAMIVDTSSGIQMHSGANNVVGYYSMLHLATKQ